MKISRRTLLRGAGAAVSLPWLESIAAGAPVSAGSALSEPPLRMAFLFMPNGVRPDYWTPAGDAVTGWEMTQHLQPLEGLRSEFLLLENLWNKNSVGRNGHWPKVPAFLSGGYVERTSGNDLNSGGTTVDQFAAQKIGPATPLQTLELGLDPPRTGIDTAGGGFARAYGSFLSWADPHTPVPKEIVPQLAFDRIFRGLKSPVVSSVDSKNPAILESLQRDETSVLDLVRDQAKSILNQSSSGDQNRLDEYFESVRAVEKRIEASMKPQKRWINQGKFPMDRPAAGIPEAHIDHLHLMMDILLLAFWTDSTRIATLMIGDAQSSQDYSFLPGVKGNWHGISHHRNIESQREQYEKIINWNVEQVAYFLKKMHSLKEGSSSILDNSMVMFGGTLKDGNRHDPENLPILLAGRAKGAIKPGRRVRFAEKTPLCNLYLTMLDTMGAHEKQFGDSTGMLEGVIG